MISLEGLLIAVAQCTAGGVAGYSAAGGEWDSFWKAAMCALLVTVIAYLRLLVDRP